MSEAPPGNGHYTDTHTHALDLLRDVLGAKVIATYAHGRAPLPDTGPCSRCGATTTRYGPNGSPLCAGCCRPAAPYSKRPQPPLRWCCIRCHRVFRERVNRPEPNAGPDRDIAAGARLGQARESVAAGFGITWARAWLSLPAARRALDTRCLRRNTPARHGICRARP